MCIIIHKTNANQKIKKHVLENAEETNPDGFGIVFLDTGEMRKTEDYDEARAWINEKRPMVAHYRYATVGNINKENCHPFSIPNSDLWLFSNGTVPLGGKEKTDTECVAEMLEGESKEVRRKILSMTDTRFCIVDSMKCKVERYGKWHKQDGVWFSKSNCFAKRSSAGFNWGNSYYGSKAYKNVNSLSTPVSDYPGSCLMDEDEWEWESYEKTPDDYQDIDMTLPAYGWNGVHKLAVYGTLKMNQGNHTLLGDSEFIGSGYTNDEYKMESLGVPYLFKNAKGSQVEVEIYEVDDPFVRDTVDSLEGHPYTYRREIVDIIDLEGNLHSCWIYFSHKYQPDDSVPHINTYNYHNANYQVQG